MRKVILLLLLATAYAWEEATCDPDCNGECLTDIYNCDDCGYNCPEGRKCIDGMCKCYTQLITFDDLTAPGVSIAPGYKGFNWDNINVYSLPIKNNNELISPYNVIYAPKLSPDLSTIFRTTPFNLVSIYSFDRGINTAGVATVGVATVTFKGYRKNVEVATTTYVTNSYAALLFVFPSEFNNIDKLTFSIVSTADGNLTPDLPDDIIFDNLLVCV
jgi:hypothetical protein